MKKVLEQARAEKVIGSSLEAKVTLYCTPEMAAFIATIPVEQWEDLMIVSQLEVVEGEGGAHGEVEGLGVAVQHAEGEKCQRCWKYTADIGSDAQHPCLCARCAAVIAE